jgi:AcrR family transcriptional regulator
MENSERKKLRKEKHRREILDAAREVFSTKSFHRATMDEIAEKAHYSPATLYLYFRNKEELYAQVNQSLPRTIAKQWQKIVNDSAKKPVDKIKNIIHLMCDLYAQYPSNMVDTLRHQPSRDSEHLSEDVLKRGEAQLAATLSSIAQIFEEGIREGLFEEHDAGVLAEAVWALLTGMVLLDERMRFVDPETPSLKRSLDLALEVFLKGLAQRGT